MKGGALCGARPFVVGGQSFLADLLPTYRQPPFHIVAARAQRRDSLLLSVPAGHGTVRRPVRPCAHAAPAHTATRAARTRRVRAAAAATHAHAPRLARSRPPASPGWAKARRFASVSCGAQLPPHSTALAGHSTAPEQPHASSSHTPGRLADCPFACRTTRAHAHVSWAQAAAALRRASWAQQAAPTECLPLTFELRGRARYR